MRQDCLFGALVAALAFHAVPAKACIVRVPIELRDVAFADAVVVGQISNYRIVLDQAVRDERREMLANSRDMSPELRDMLERQTGFLSDYAKFEVSVVDILAGEAPRNFSVTWDNSTFPEPQAMQSGTYVLAVRNPDSAGPPLRGPSATILVAPEKETLTLLQAPCSGAFIFEAGSSEAETVRRILTEGR